LKKLFFSDYGKQVFELHTGVQAASSGHLFLKSAKSIAGHALFEVTADGLQHV